VTATSHAAHSNHKEIEEAMKRLDECGFQLDAWQSKALDLALKGKNVCVLGKAGTGKSALARAIARHCSES